MSKDQIISLCHFLADGSNTPFEYFWQDDQLTKQGALLVAFVLIAMVQGFCNKFFRKENEDGKSKENV